MERRSDMRRAMRSLLSRPQQQPEESNVITLPRPPVDSDSLDATAAVSYSVAKPRGTILTEIQSELSECGIETSAEEIAQALFETMTTRPSLCRGLLAAYLTGDS